MIYVLCSILNEASALTRMWESVQATIPGEVTLVVVDGKFPDYDAPDDLSTDGTREYAEANGHLVTSTDYECEQRTAGLRFIDTLASEGDWVLNMDADETITNFFCWPERIGYIEFTRKTLNEATYGRCRLYRWEPGLEFKGRHYDLYEASGELVASLEDAPDYQVIGTGDHFETRPRPAAKLAYYKNLRKREASPWEVRV